MEVGPAADVYQRPFMAYTRALTSAVLLPDPIRESRALVRYCKVTCFSGRSTLRLPFPHTLPIRDCAVRRSETELREIRLGHFAACSRIGPQQTDIEQA